MNDESRSNVEYQENLLRDLCAVSTFGDMEQMLEDLRASNEPANDFEKPRSLLMIPSTQRRNRRRFGGNCVIVPDDDIPKSMGRGAVAKALAGTVPGFQHFDDLNRGLREIGSGSYRNESIEAFIDEEQERRQFETNDDEDASPAKESTKFSSTTTTTPPTEKSPLQPSSSVTLPAKKSSPAAKVEKVKKRRNAALLSILAKKMTAVGETSDCTVPSLLLQNPTLARQSPLIENVYVPNIVETEFTYHKPDFPPL